MTGNVYRLFTPFLLTPRGLEQHILWLFVFLLIMNVIHLIQQRRQDLLVPVIIHGLGGMAAVLAGNLIILLISWEVLSFSAFSLLWLNKENRARRAAVQYLLMQVGSAVFFFIAIAIHVQNGGTYTLEILHPSSQPFLLIAVAMKTASVPLHFWLTDAYSTAMPVIAPFLTGFATKVGVITAFRLTLPELWGFPALAALGGVTAVVGVFLALQQTQARKLLSFHIVSQVGYMSAALGMGAGTAGLYHLVTHTLYKSLLFFVALEAARHFGHEDMKKMGDLGKKRPWLALAGILGAAAISGVPFTSGFASKEVIKMGLYGTFPYTMLWIASVGTGLSFIKFVYLIFFRKANGGAIDRNTQVQTPESGQSVHIPILLTSLATLFLGLFPGFVPNLPRESFWNWDSLIKATYPLGGSIIGWIVFRTYLVNRRESHPLWKSDFQTRVLASWFWAERKLTRLHNHGPRFQVVLMLTTFLVLLWLGILMLGRPVPGGYPG